LVAIKASEKRKVVLEGPVKIVEIDQSLFVKVKHNKGSAQVSTVWVLGDDQKTSRLAMVSIHSHIFSIMKSFKFFIN
jgi:hypothetical protein